MSFALTDAHLPATLNCQPMTDDEFAKLCSDHPDLSFEMTADGELIVMAPTYTESGFSSAALMEQFAPWARRNGRGFVGDSSTGYVLPNGARRSPDLSWTLKQRMKQLKPGRKKSFWRLCPDFVIELRSDSDRPRASKDKMQEYIANGAQLGWLIDPTDRSVTIYRPNFEPETRINVSSVSGEGPIASFTLELETVWNPLGDE